MNSFIQQMTEFFQKLTALRDEERNLWVTSLKREGNRKLTPIDISILETIYKKTGSYAEIVEILKENKSTVTQAISRLEKENYVEKDKNCKLRKPKFILMPKGFELAYRLDNIDHLLLSKILCTKNNYTNSYAKVLEEFFRTTNERFPSYMTQAEGEDALSLKNVARFYDCLIGGQYFFPVDYQASHIFTKNFPFLARSACANRGFMRRAVSFLAKRGVTQFIDIGAGLLSNGNPHDIIAKYHNNYKVLYVDNDPYVVNAMQNILSNETNVKFIEADIAKPEDILKNAKNFGIDLSKPVAILTIAVFHFIKDINEVKKVIKVLSDKIVKDSYFILSHLHISEALYKKGNEIITRYNNVVTNVYPRTQKEIQEMVENANLKLLPYDKKGKVVDLIFTPLWQSDIPDNYLFNSEPPLLKDREYSPDYSLALAGVWKKV